MDHVVLDTTHAPPCYLDIDRINDNTLLPAVLHSLTDLLSTLVTDQRADQVHGSVNATGAARSGNDTHATKSHGRSAHDTLTSRIAHLARLTALPHRRVAALSPRVLLEHVRVVLQVLTEIEAALVDDVPFALEHLGAGLELFLRRFLRQDLQLDVLLWPCGSTQALQYALAGQEQRAGVHTEDGTFLAGIVFLEIGERADQAQRLGLVLQDLLEVAAGDDEDVVVFERLVGVFVGGVGAERGA